MDTVTIAKLKLECYKVVLEDSKGQNKSPENLLKEAGDLYNFITRL